MDAAPGLQQSHSQEHTRPHTRGASVQSYIDASLENGRSISSELQHTISIAVNESLPRNYRSIVRDPPANASRSHSRCRANCYFQRASCREHVGFFCAIGVSAYFGVLARIYLTELAAWNGLPLFPAFYSEVVGTAFMGFVVSHKRLLEKNHKFTYQALATGLCGSLTTFSSWNNDATTVLIQYGDDDPDNITRAIGWVTVLIVGFGMPIAALGFGKHVSHLSPWADRRAGNRVYKPPTKVMISVEIFSYVIFWFIATSVVVIIPLVILFSRYDFMFSFVLALLGAYLRWHLSPLNSAFQNFKLGTFLVNVLGTWLLGTVYLLDHHYEEQTGIEVKGLLYGVTAGFCGCLTTVSTFAVELSTLPLAGAYLYGVSSVLAAQIGLVIIRGTYWWTR